MFYVHVSDAPDQQFIKFPRLSTAKAPVPIAILDNSDNSVEFGCVQQALADELQRGNVFAAHALLRLLKHDAIGLNRPLGPPLVTV